MPSDLGESRSRLKDSLGSKPKDMCNQRFGDSISKLEMFLSNRGEDQIL